MKITITGADGYIGQALCHALHDKEWAQVQIFDTKRGTQEDIRNSGVHKKIHDFAPDIIYNLAGISGEVAAQRDRPRTFTTNGRAPSLLWDAAPGAKFVQASTASCYGTRGLSTSEVQKLPYAESKWLGEELLRDVAEKGRDGLVLLRFGTVFGVYHPRCDVRRDLPLHRMILNAQDNALITVPRETMWRPFLWIHSLIHQLLQQAELLRKGVPTPYHPFPLPLTSFNTTIQELATYVADTIDEPGSPVAIKVDAKEFGRGYTAPSTIGMGFGMLPDEINYLRSVLADQA